MTSSVQALQFFNYVLDVGRITFRLISTSQHRLLTQHEPRSALAHTHHFSLKQSADHSHNYRNVMNIIIRAKTVTPMWSYKYKRESAWQQSKRTVDRSDIKTKRDRIASG